MTCDNVFVGDDWNITCVINSIKGGRAQDKNVQQAGAQCNIWRQFNLYISIITNHVDCKHYVSRRTISHLMFIYFGM